MKTILSLALLLTGCASGPPAPDWQTHAYAALKGFSAAYLSGNTRLADLEFARATAALSSTGRADLLARAELTRCAVRVASLEFDHCANYQPLAPDAPPSEQAYAAYLTGEWQALDPALLPAQHRPVVVRATRQPTPAQENQPERSMLNSLEDPLARLVAAGVLLQKSQISPADIALATETASAQGWRRPLLAWLGVQRKRAEDAGERDAVTRLQRRMDLVLQTPAKAQ